MDIQIKNLSKIYRGPTPALSDISFVISSGIFGLLGPNGAGKTTLLRILATLIRPTSGTARVGGYRTDHNHEKWAIKQILGYLPQDIALYGDLSATEFLDFVAALKGLKEARQRKQQRDYVLEITGLAVSANQRLKTYSGGMRRRVGIAQALLGDPKVLIVDEPTAGLDPQERVRFRNLLVELAQERLVLLSTHIVEDVAHTCERVAVLREGKLVFNGNVTELLQLAQGRVWEFETTSYQPSSENVLVSSVRTMEGQRVRVLAPTAPLDGIRPTMPNIEDGYLWLMHRKE